MMEFPGQLDNFLAKVNFLDIVLFLVPGPLKNFLFLKFGIKRVDKPEGQITTVRR